MHGQFVVRCPVIFGDTMCVIRYKNFQYGGNKEIKFAEFQGTSMNKNQTSKEIDRWKNKIRERTEQFMKQYPKVVEMESDDDDDDEIEEGCGYKIAYENVKIPDEETLIMPYVNENVDHDKIAEILQQTYPSIVGYHKNEYDISDRCFFHVMKKCLQEVNKYKLDPKFFYHSLYLIFPIRGSANKMSQIFPTLAEKFDARLDALTLEPWKNDETDTKSFSSHGNHFSYCVPLPYKVDDSNCKSTECFKREDRTTPIDRKDSDRLQIFVKKSVNIKGREHFLPFMNHLFSTKDPDFCRVAKKFETLGTCKELHEFVLGLEMRITEPMEAFPRKLSPNERYRFHERREDVEKEITEKSEQELERLKRGVDEGTNSQEDLEAFQLNMKNESCFSSPANPCTHFGPCGPGNEDCSCKNFCSPFCQCDINCKLRFQGCKCKPGECGTNRCHCANQWLECIPGRCTNCCSEETKDSNAQKLVCKNSILSRKAVPCLLKSGKSKIAGTGAFLTVDVEKGDCVGEYIGHHISMEETERRDELYKFAANNYLFQLPNGQGNLDGALIGNATRFVNHSSENPNLSTTYRNMLNGNSHILFIAEMDMKAGTEVTIDYGYPKECEKVMFTYNHEKKAQKYIDEYDEECQEIEKEQRKKNRKRPAQRIKASPPRKSRRVC
ncbi:hypothetical protein L3Y34_003854 [Caenorhabditis briggsae]|uniref:Uncharacterized protein n=2 Tax=Caenorhabditis briggsae TaxID=6238 RepID=A0AAE9AGT1_CAEBR|nr:hypothetical protein L3Y34_003854 [Caenorhabditis briggsae]